MAANNAINNTLQTPFNVGATSVTSTGTQLNLLNALTVVPINKVVVQTFSSNNTYTPTTGLVYCIVEIVGGGGGSGGTTGVAAQGSASGGGGGGGYCRKFYTSTLIGANAAVVIGAAGAAGTNTPGNGGNGGNSTFTPAGAGAILTASGGTGSPLSTASASSSAAGGGNGGAGTNGDLNIQGEYGSYGWWTAAGALATGGKGGNSFFGYGGPSITQAAGSAFAGQGANNYGGGAGGAENSSTAANTLGSAGAVGICIVTEFVSS